MDSAPDSPVSPSEQPKGRWFFGGAIAVSLLLHAVVGAALISELRERLPEVEEAAISVELVTAPEPKEPEEEPPEAETAEHQPAQPEEQPQSGEELAALPVLRPVYEFAEEDTGPQSDPDEVSANDAEENQKAETGPEIAENEAVETLPDSERIVDAEAIPEDSASAGPIAVLVAPTPKPGQNPPAAAGQEAEDPRAMTPAKHLYSDAILNDPTFRTAMAGLPRSRRASLLCMTEMRDQLRAASRPPEMLPSYRLPAGTVLEPRRAAFRTQGQWFDLAFRCEVDQQVTRVLKFSYRIGDAIPRAQWSQRGFPNL